MNLFLILAAITAGFEWGAGSGDGLGQRQAISGVEAIQSLVVDAELSGQLPKAHGLAGVLDANRARSVGQLLIPGRPSAILRAVRSIVVDAVEGVSSGTRPHITQKSLEVVAPLIADSDAPAAVPMVLDVAGIEAALFHANPRDVLTAMLLGQGLTSPTPLKAAAALGSPAPQVGTPHLSDGAAVARTNPPHALYLVGSTKHRPPAYTVPCQVNEVGARGRGASAHCEHGTTNIAELQRLIQLLGPYPCPIKRDKNGHIIRNAANHRRFLRDTGFPTGRPGYVVDHVIPLCACGADEPPNYQWQTIADAKAKDVLEKRACYKLAHAVASPVDSVPLDPLIAR